MAFGDWRAVGWLRLRRAKRARKREKFMRALAATRFVTVATIVDAYYLPPRGASNDNTATRRIRPPLTVIS